MTKIQKVITPDLFGALASSLCLVHCAATPFLFIAKACSSTCCADSPIWWQAIDYLFIVVSFVAIYFATKKSTKTWIQTAFWGSWILLLFTLLAETFELGLFSKSFIYVPAFAIVGLHFYNLKYCQCSEEECCLGMANN
jgi:hypothetical protein